MPPVSLKSPATPSVFDVGRWFLDKGLETKFYVQPRKLQCLLFLAQGYYLALTRGRLLIPAVFLADEKGPMEPSSYRVFEQGCPSIFYPPLSEEVTFFLEKIWERFAKIEAEDLVDQIFRHPPFLDALKKGNRTEIDRGEMQEFYGGKRAAVSASHLQKDEVKLRRSHTGMAVKTSPWLPKKQP